jgi:hypothetical protein
MDIFAAIFEQLYFALVFEFKSKEKFELDHLTTVIKHGKW